MDKLLLIDGNSLAYRAYYATAYSSAGVMKNQDGVPINAVLALTRMIVKTIETYKPTHVFIAFDAGSKTVRHDKLESYKAGRTKTPPELIQQMSIIKDMFTTMGISHYELDGIEADDLIGTLATEHCENVDVMVLSSDKDMYQLVGPRTSIIVPQNGAKPDLLINQDNFVEINSYHPHQVPDMKGLVGDASDNLPGVAGIGPKGAIKLITEYKTLEGIYENIENIKGSTKEKLIKSKDTAFLCKDIATIFKDIEIPFTYDDLELGDIYNQEAIKFYEKLHLKSIVNLFEQKSQNKQKNEVKNYSNLVL